MMILATWNTLDEVAAYLLDRTGEPWTPRSILERFSELKPEAVTICPPTGIPILILKDGHWENWAYGSPMLFAMGGSHADGCLHQWLISNSASNVQMVRGNDRFQTTAQIPMECVRIHRSDVDKLPTTFHRLIDELAQGHHPELEVTLDLIDTSPPHCGVSLQHAELQVQFLSKGATRQRADAMSNLLAELVPEMVRQGKNITAGTVMEELKKVKDSCVVDVKPEGAVWERFSGQLETLTVTALQRRLKRMGFVGKNARS